VHGSNRFWRHYGPVAKSTLYLDSLLSVSYVLQRHKLCKNDGAWCCNKLPGTNLDFANANVVPCISCLNVNKAVGHDNISHSLSLLLPSSSLFFYTYFSTIRSKTTSFQTTAKLLISFLFTKKVMWTILIIIDQFPSSLVFQKFLKNSYIKGWVTISTKKF